MPTPDIRELSSDEEVCEAFPIVAELRDHLDEARYLKLYERLRTGIDCSRWTTGSGRCRGSHDPDDFYLDRYAYVYDLVTTDRERSKRHGHGCSSTSANGPPIVTAKSSNSRQGCGATMPTGSTQRAWSTRSTVTRLFVTCSDRRRGDQPTISANRRSWSR